MMAACPSCRKPLEPHQFDGHYGRVIPLDLCFGCEGIWFDRYEHLQLSAGGLLRLFRVIHEGNADGRNPLGRILRCPRCGRRLRDRTDTQRGSPFQYFSCRADHGQFLTFYQFLRSKNFVRSLTPIEVKDLRTRIRQMNCSNCGAPIDLETHAACAYCRSPIAMLDPEQLERTLAELRAAEEKRQQPPDPMLPVRLLQERLHAERVFADAAQRSSGGAGARWADLVDLGLSAFIDAFDGH